MHGEMLRQMMNMQEAAAEAYNERQRQDAEMNEQEGDCTTFTGTLFIHVQKVYLLSQ